MYTAVGTLWLLAALAGAPRAQPHEPGPRLQPPQQPRRRWWIGAAIAASWLVLQGFPPILSPAGNTLLSLPSQLATIAIAIVAVWPTPDPHQKAQQQHPGQEQAARPERRVA
jgi:hypothetical protein